MISDALAHRLTINELVAVYERAERDIRAGFDLVAGAEEALTGAFAKTEHCGIHVRGRFDGRTLNFRAADDVLVEIRRQVWWSLVERLELRRFMSISAWEKLQKKLKDGEPPEITRETVAGMAKQFHDAMPSMLEESVREVYEWLRPRGGTRHAEYKTNSVLEVGPKVVLGWMVESDWAQHWHVNYNRQQQLTALENVFTSLDGKGSITKTHRSALENAINAIPKSEPCVGETPYFAFKGFRNRNLHLTFKRLDLLARFNQIAGGARLRPAAAE